MDPIAVAPLAISIWKLIKPYVQNLGGVLIEKTVDSLPDMAGKVWDTVKNKMESKPETQNLPVDLVQAPEDEDAQDAFKYQLKKLLENDETFAKQLSNLVNQATQETAYSSILKGDGAIAQGNNSIAIGRGGVHIGGNVSGSNVITGNDNAASVEKKRRRKK